MNILNELYAREAILLEISLERDLRHFRQENDEGSLCDWYPLQDSFFEGIKERRDRLEFIKDKFSDREFYKIIEDFNKVLHEKDVQPPKKG